MLRFRHFGTQCQKGKLGISSTLLGENETKKFISRPVGRQGLAGIAAGHQGGVCWGPLKNGKNDKKLGIVSKSHPARSEGSQ
jgi:hypothetical protein